ncbi:MAG: TPM domain-containing protein [Rhodocyclaceae bacterium]|nr:TPM domain-containing protein [Rhodocyclaceae bacterium]
MRQVWHGLLAVLWLALLPAIGMAADLVPVPVLSARVTDLTGTLDATQKGRLEAQLAAIERAHGAQIAVLMLPGTQPEAIEAFGIRLAEAWKIGHKGADNGVIVIVAKEDRKMRIEVGYGLEGAIPDVVAKRIIAERMAPLFRQGDFFGGLRSAIEGLEQAMGGPASGAPAELPPAGGSNSAEGSSGLLPWLMAAVVAGGVLRMMFGVLGSFAAAAVAGWLGLAIFGSWLAALLAGLAIFVLSFFNLFSLGGMGGGFGGGSSSGGGFGGGGGSFGGGGASGNW